MYRPPVPFTGGLRDVVCEVEGPLIDGTEEKLAT